MGRVWQYLPPGPEDTTASAFGWYASVMPGKNVVPVASSVCHYPPRPAGDTTVAQPLRGEYRAFSDIRTGKSSLLRVLSEAAPETPANSAQQRYCPPSLISLPCILFPDVPFFPDAFSCRRPHLSVPLLIRQNSAGSLSSNARRNTFGSPLPATTSAIRTDMTLICRTRHRTKPIWCTSSAAGILRRALIRRMASCGEPQARIPIPTSITAGVYNSPRLITRPVRPVAPTFAGETPHHPEDFPFQPGLFMARHLGHHLNTVANTDQR